MRGRGRKSESKGKRGKKTKTRLCAFRVPQRIYSSWPVHHATCILYLTETLLPHLLRVPIKMPIALQDEDA